MKRLCKKGGILLTAVSLSFSGGSFAQHDESVPMTSNMPWTGVDVDLMSNGGVNSYRLPDDATQVDLLQQTSGSCRFGRSWGYDLSHKELWVNSGCGGRFRVTRAAAAPSQGSGSNAGYAIAAVAAVAGLALLANHNSNNNRPNDNNAYQGPQGGYPPGGQGGQYAPPMRGGQFRSVGGLCLDVDKVNGAIRPGSAVQIWACNGGENQRFYWGRNGEIAVGNLCLDIADANPNDGARMIVWQCSGAPNQRWQARGRDIVSQLNGKCLAVWEGQARNGQRVVTWGCNGSTNQNWWW